MKPTKKQILKWTAALRSGEFTQGKGKLQTRKGYCCLGVACSIFIPKSKQLRCESYNMLIGSVPAAQPHSPRWLNEIVHDFSYRAGYSLPYLNDYGRMSFGKMSFDEIADMLELVYVHKMLD